MILILQLHSYILNKIYKAECRKMGEGVENESKNWQCY